MPESQVALSEIEAGREVVGTYRLKQCLLRQTPQGKHFILGEIADGGGALGFVWWNASGATHEKLRASAHVKINGKAERYRERLQLVANVLEPTLPSDELAASLEPEARCDIEREWQDLLRIVDSFTNPHLKALLRAIFIDDESIAVRFKRAPAAVSMHHPWPGGLLAHSVQMARGAEAMATLYPRLDRDLLLSAVLLHDLCKIDEISFEGSYEYTTAGNLIGHVVMGAQLVFAKCLQLPDFPQRLREKLQHCILAHHGQLEWGAAREPMLPEAFVLHYIDNIDARLEAGFRSIDESASGDPDWTDFNKMLGVRVYRGE
ncbi:MAG: HD domain-containing protein [Planctomycetota bacterium]|jgi:3'-5' exoribonuclease|nr:HD domain-containing protein [Planctomycetota bacterium]